MEGKRALQEMGPEQEAIYDRNRIESPLLRLPAELRNLIFRNLLTNIHIHIREADDPSTPYLRNPHYNTNGTSNTSQNNVSTTPNHTSSTSNPYNPQNTDGASEKPNSPLQNHASPSSDYTFLPPTMPGPSEQEFGPIPLPPMPSLPTNRLSEERVRLKIEMLDYYSPPPSLIQPNAEHFRAILTKGNTGPSYEGTASNHAGGGGGNGKGRERYPGNYQSQRKPYAIYPLPKVHLISRQIYEEKHHELVFFSSASLLAESTAQLNTPTSPPPEKIITKTPTPQNPPSLTHPTAHTISYLSTSRTDPESDSNSPNPTSATTSTDVTTSATPPQTSSNIFSFTRPTSITSFLTKLTTVQKNSITHLWIEDGKHYKMAWAMIRRWRMSNVRVAFIPSRVARLTRLTTEGLSGDPDVGGMGIFGSMGSDDDDDATRRRHGDFPSTTDDIGISNDENLRSRNENENRNIHDTTISTSSTTIATTLTSPTTTAIPNPQQTPETSSSSSSSTSKSTKQEKTENLIIGMGKNGRSLNRIFDLQAERFKVEELREDLENLSLVVCVVEL